MTPYNGRDVMGHMEDYYPKTYYVHKYEVSQQYGGPEEGGWYYDSGIPTGFTFGPIDTEDEAYDQCRALNVLEHERAEKYEEYGYTSVLSYRSIHFAYGVEEDPTPKPYPEERPYYE